MGGGILLPVTTTAQKGLWLARVRAAPGRTRRRSEPWFGEGVSMPPPAMVAVPMDATCPGGAQSDSPRRGGALSGCVVSATGCE